MRVFRPKKIEMSRVELQSLRICPTSTLTELFEAGTGLQQDVANIMDGPGIQLSERHLQKHAVEGRDQIHVPQAVRQGLSGEERCNKTR